MVEVAEDQTNVHLTVRDDGNGFDATAKTSGFGLLGMHERAELVGGTLDIETAPGNGTTIRAWLPAQRRGADRIMTGPRATSAR